MIRLSFAADRVLRAIALAVLVAVVPGCVNVGSKFDFRKYPTPICADQLQPRSHIWCPELPSDVFEKGMQQMYSRPVPPMQQMPKGPATPASMTSCYPPFSVPTGQAPTATP